MVNKQFWEDIRDRACRALAAVPRAVRGIWAPANYGFIVLFALCVLTIALTYLGFVFQASTSAPAQVPVPPSLSVSFAPGSVPPASLSIYTFLEETPAPTKLIITATGTFAPPQVLASWTLDIQEFTGYLCPGQPALHMIPLSQQGKNDYFVEGDSPVSQISGVPFFTVRLCWDHGSPLISSGSYVSASLSPVLAPVGQSGTVTRSLVLGGSSLSSYTLAGGLPPTAVSAQAWIWSSSLGGEIQNQARFDIPIIASSLPGIQHDNQDAFYSGIFFGIAGGAAVSIIPALLDAVDRHKSRRKHAAGHGDPHPADRRPLAGAEVGPSPQDSETTARSHSPATPSPTEQPR
jgi:hypothetical protein